MKPYLFILAFLLLAVPGWAEPGDICTLEGGKFAGYDCRMQEEQRHLREVQEYVPPTPILVPVCVYENGTLRDYPCQVPRMDIEGRVIDTPCLAQMEAAMKAMELFLSPFLRFSYHDGKWWIERELESDTVADKVFEAEKQWNAAKRDCWRTP